MMMQDINYLHAEALLILGLLVLLLGRRLRLGSSIGSFTIGVAIGSLWNLGCDRGLVGLLYFFLRYRLLDMVEGVQEFGKIGALGVSNRELLLTGLTRTITVG